MTADGLVVGRNADGTRVAPPAKGAAAATTYATAEWLWMSDPANLASDYHHHVTAQPTLDCVKHRLFPTLRQLYPGRRYILFLDNSSNHTAMPDDYLSPETCTKGDAVEYLRRVSDWSSITVQRDRETLRFRRKVWDKNKAKSGGGPSQDEIRQALKDWYTLHPEQCRSKLQLLFDKEVCSLPTIVVTCSNYSVLLCCNYRAKVTNGIRLLMVISPPYESESQPIEKLWARVKGFVARVDHIKRTPTAVRKDVVEGLYGGDRFNGVSASDCQSYISTRRTLSISGL